MRDEKNEERRRFGLVTLAFILLLSASLRAEAQDTGWSIGLGLTSGTARPENGREIDIGGIGLFGRWQHKNSGWGAMAEIAEPSTSRSTIPRPGSTSSILETRLSSGPTRSAWSSASSRTGLGAS